MKTINIKLDYWYFVIFNCHFSIFENGMIEGLVDRVYVLPSMNQLKKLQTEKY